MARLGALLAIALLVLTALIGGVRGLAYAAAYCAALLPGLPLGWRLFGRSPAGSLAGAVIGFGLSAIAIWIPIALRAPSIPAITISWGVMTAAIWVTLFKLRPPLAGLPAWTRDTTRAVCLVMLLAPAITAAPYLHIGQRDAEGNRRYRAYFTADFVWHEALTAELSRWSFPPRNPYMVSRPLNYYWAYYLLPATATHAMKSSPAIEEFLAINALGTATLFAGMIFLFAWASVPRPAVAATAVALTVLAASAEGLYAVVDLLRRGRPVSFVRYLNIDAVTSWPPLSGIAIDGLPRSMWYNPQHSLACALGLVALTVAAREGAAMSWRAAALSGLALGLALVVSPFPGGAMTLIYGAALLWHMLSTPRSAPVMLTTQFAAIAPVALAYAWDVFNKTFEGAGTALAFGLSSGARRSLGWLLLLAVGPVLIPAVVGIAAAIGRRWLSSMRPAIAAAVIALTLMFFVTLVVEPIWIGWRAGQVLLVTIPALVAAALAAVRDRLGGGAMAASAALILVVGLPTTVIDVYNAQDTSNLEMGPGFRWTVVISRDEQDALHWIEQHTPAQAVVQMSLEPRGRETWSLIPSFARRRMAAGLPISLMRTPEYDERAARADRIYSTNDAAEAAQLARELRIDYLYVGDVERNAYGAALEKFDAHPELFSRDFRNSAAAVYAVR